MNIPENLLIPYLHSNMLNQKATADLNTFLDKCCLVLGDFSPQQASQVLQRGLEKGQYIVTHYKTIEPLIVQVVQGTAEGTELRKSFQRTQAAAHRAIDFVDQLGYPVDPGVVQLWNVNNAPNVNLADMVTDMRTIHGFYNVGSGLPSLSTPKALNFSGK